MTCCWRPTPASDNSSCTSSRRHGTLLMAYSLSPLRNSVRRTVTSENSIGRMPEELSIVRLTSARPSAGRDAVPAKITSSIFWLRTALGAWAPSTQAMASTTLDLPDPLGPTTHVMPGSKWKVVADAKDLKPLRVRLFRCTRGISSRPATAGPWPRGWLGGCVGTYVGRGRPGPAYPDPPRWPALGAPPPAG